MKKLTLILASAVIGLGQADAADGKALYATCSACHQANGAGIPGAFPPLAESEWVNGPVENLIRIQLRGLMGPIKVKGVEYNSMMPPNASMSDEEIAAVLSYIRSNFGNTSGPVTPDQVKALRSEAGKPPLKADELIDPNEAPKEEAKPAGEEGAQAEPAAPAKVLAAGDVTEQGDVTKSDVQSGPNKLVWGGFAAWTLLCIFPVVTGVGRKKG
ncbi:c-type cytochrome [Rubritalea spongiae]|uniref:C-type cytochrome n=1 Tax=Rubritalea spongiae TaxID=430797 RepID=A0ABW5DZ80_9BACT